MAQDDDPTTDFLRRMYAFDELENLYKEQLASALIAFNRIENMLCDIIMTVLVNRGRPDLVPTFVGKQFGQRLEAVELLMTSLPEAPRVPAERLRALAKERNSFAHGYFTADANTGEGLIMGKGKAVPWNPEAIVPFLDECASLRSLLAGVMLHAIFGDEKPELPPGAIPIPE